MRKPIGYLFVMLIAFFAGYACAAVSFDKGASTVKLISLSFDAAHAQDQAY